MSGEVTTRDDDNLTERQEAFVVAYATNGGDAKAAAIEAGYSPDSARTLGPRLLRQEKILRGIHAETMKRLAALGPKAIACQESLLSARSEFVRAQVSDSLLDRVMGKAIARVEARVTGALSVSIDLGGDA